MRSHTQGKDWMKISKKNYLDQQELMKELQNESRKKDIQDSNFYSISG